MHHSLHLLITTFLNPSFLQHTQARRHGFIHQAADTSPNSTAKDESTKLLTINFTVTEQSFTPTSPILGVVFPSPKATPIKITTQSQVITSFIPELTWCVGPPIGLIPVTSSLGPPYLNHSIKYLTTIAGTGYCETVYRPTTTTVCATTLTGLASKVAITDCDQQVTFSSECGFTLETPSATRSNYSLITPAPTIQSMMTYWMAPWQSLTRGEAPSDVDIKICKVLDNSDMECIRYQEVWQIVVVTQTITTSRQVNLATIISGPGTLIVETMQVLITDTIETVDLSTVLLLQTEIETETTKKEKKPVTGPNQGRVLPISTVYVTKKAKHVSKRQVCLFVGRRTC